MAQDRLSRQEILGPLVGLATVAFIWLFPHLMWVLGLVVLFCVIRWMEHVHSTLDQILTELRMSKHQRE